MSKHETKMTRWYAKMRYPKGFLMEEFLALNQGKANGKRLMDGVIVFRKPYVKRKLSRASGSWSSSPRTDAWAWG